MSEQNLTEQNLTEQNLSEQTLSEQTISLLPSFNEDAPIAWWRGGAVSYPHFLAAVSWLAGQLPAARHAINLCEDRFLFLVGFSAVISRLQTNLLPSNRLAEEINKVAEAYPDCYCLVEKEIPGVKVPQVVCRMPGSLPIDAGPPPRIPADHVAAVAFTSGSTGAPKPNPKTWRSLVIGAELWKARFWSGQPGHLALVATVPPQHMYGLETTILLPMVVGVGIYGGRPFFPETIREVLENLPPPHGLITTPIHMRACVEAGLSWPQVSFLISATAPLPAPLARRAEAVFSAPVLEIYGCTEGGSLASRRTLEGDLWRLYDGVTLHQDNGAAIVKGGHLPEPVPLQDLIAKESDTTFRLTGRNSDLVNIAGKRGSLADLNIKLSQVDGVTDGVFVMPGVPSAGTARLAALVVAPGRTEAEILAGLEGKVDPAFMPRPLLLVEALPYNETGKLPMKTLQEWILHKKSRGQ